MTTTEAIVRTAIYLNAVHSTNGFTPDYQLMAASERFGLDLEECRQIRDIVGDMKIHEIKL